MTGTILETRAAALCTRLIANGCPASKAPRIAKRLVDWHWPLRRGFVTGVNGRPLLASDYAVDCRKDRASGIEWLKCVPPHASTPIFVVWNDHTCFTGTGLAEVMHLALTERDFYCRGCNQETHVGNIGEYSFVLHDAVWTAITGGARGDRKMYCVECLERKAGRKLNETDFDWTIPLNTIPVFRSDRLKFCMAAKPKDAQ